MYGIQNLKPLEITFDWLFQRINQEDVYRQYLGFCELNKKFKNPLREDKRADCSFYWDKGILFFKDFNWKAFTCVSIVMEIEGVNYHKALQLIYNGFQTNTIIVKHSCSKVEKQKKKIDVKIKPFNEDDINYLKSFNIDSKLCKLYRVFSVEHYWIDNKLVYTYNPKDRCLGYYFGNGEWKLYHMDRNDYRFVGNISGKDLQGYNQIDKSGELLIITKSLKDVMVYKSFGINAVAPHSECIGEWCHHIDELKERFKKVILNFDNDKTGIKVSKEINEKFNIPYFLVNDEKDISDYVKHFGEEKTKQLLNENFI